MPGGHCSPRDQTCIDRLSSVPVCPVVNGVPDLSQPCNVPPSTCGGGLACADGTSCRQGCTARTDCASRYQRCGAGGSACLTDDASRAATSQGVTPVDWTPPRLRSSREIADIMIDAGLHADDAGVIQLPMPSLGGVVLAYDPNRRTPANGMRLCVDSITTCMVMKQSTDACVAATARCSSSTPWLGDPAGDDCCPEACLLAYFNARANSSSASALQSMLVSGCYGTLADGGAQ